MTLLLDVGSLTCDCTDHTLEQMYKAIGDPPGSSKSFTLHENPFLTDHIEIAYRRVWDRFVDIESDLKSLVRGRFNVGDTFKKSAGSSNHTHTLNLAEYFTKSWLRWKDDDLEKLARKLRNIPIDEYTIDDWMLAVEWIIQKHLPDGVIRSDAEYLAVRSAALGRLEAFAPDDLSDKQKRSLAVRIPETGGVLARLASYEDIQNAVVEFAQARAAELITDIGDRARHRLQQVILDYEQRRRMGDPTATVGDLEGTLLDEFGILNRDWRRIAVTEAGRNANEGLVASMPDGTKLKRIEAYTGACPFCRSIDGKIVTVVDPSKKDKDWEKEVWVGKTNVGRSASPRKRVGDELVERMPAEMWTIAAGLQHPNCRGGWKRMSDVPPGVDPVFADWLGAKLAEV